MKIPEALKKTQELQYLIGTKIPGTEYLIDDIIPAPNDNQFKDYYEYYLYNQDINQTIKEFKTRDFEILLLANSKKDTLTILTHTVNAWYKDHY